MAADRTPSADRMRTEPGVRCVDLLHVDRLVLAPARATGKPEVVVRLGHGIPGPLSSTQPVPGVVA